MVEIEMLTVIRGAIPARDSRAVMDRAEVDPDAVCTAWDVLNRTSVV